MEEKQNRVFFNQNGKFYAAPAPLHESDCESTFPTQDMITVLSKEQAPISREVMIGKIIELGHARVQATLAPTPETPDA